MRVPDRPSAFTSGSARDRYHAVYDRVLAGDAATRQEAS